MFVIERFQERDLVTVMELVNRTLPEQYPPDFFLRLAQIHGHLFRVARDPRSGRVLGCILATKQPALRANILVFAVDPDFQGQGIGRALLRGVQQTLSVEDVRELELEVRPDNRQAMGFYRRHGFHVSGLEEKAYRDGSDALTMSKPIL